MGELNMGTNKTSQKSREEWLKEVQERLDWYTFEASDEEFDAKEVEALVTLLGTLEADSAGKMPEPKADFEKLMHYIEEKNADAERLAALRRAEITDDAENAEAAEKARLAAESVSSVPRSRGGIWGRSRFVKIASVAAVLVALTVGGAVGAASAAKGGDYMLWLRKDKQGEKVVVEPKKNILSQANQETGTVYYAFEDVPEEYRRYLVDLDEMEHLEGYELIQIEINEHEARWRMNVLLKLGQQKIDMGVIVYQEVAVRESSFDDYEYVGSENIGEREFDLYQKPDNAAGQDTMICFYDEGIQYFVGENSSVEALEPLAEEYAEKVFEKF